MEGGQLRERRQTTGGRREPSGTFGDLTWHGCSGFRTVNSLRGPSRYHRRLAPVRWGYRVLPLHLVHVRESDLNLLVHTTVRYYF